MSVNSIGMAIQAIEDMDIPPEHKKRIFEGNARKKLRLPI
jgi:hypothetical protein